MTSPHPHRGGDVAGVPGGDAGDAEIRSALAAASGLSSSDIDLIGEVMRGAKIGFTEAALRVGLITPEDVRRAMGLHAGSNAGPGAAAVSRSHGAEVVVRPVSWRGRRDALLQDQPLGSAVRLAPELTAMGQRFGGRSEQILALRTELLLTLGHAPSQACMIAVVSSTSGDGRSRLAAELAISFAQLRDSTLLVDGDMRNPAQHRLFEGANVQAGLAQAIVNGQEPSVQPVEGLPELSVLTAGTVPENPLDLLSDARFDDLVALWRSQYRFVIFDTPPIAQCADALSVAHAAGRALIVCRANQTSYEPARAMLRRLAMTQAEVMGAVLNHF